jgi:TP901 family phage tail tape measure protein
MTLLKNSTMLSTLGNLEATDATSKLTAVVNAYNVSAEDSIKIVDTLIELDNILAANTAGIADGMQKASSMAKQAGVSYQNLASYIGVVISNTQQAGDTVGQAFSR